MSISFGGFALTVFISLITFTYIETLGIRHVPAWAATVRHLVRQSVQAVLGAASELARKIGLKWH